MLLPLVDIEPGLVHPLRRSTVAELLREILSVDDQASGVGGQRVLPMGWSNGETRYSWVGGRRVSRASGVALLSVVCLVVEWVYPTLQ